MGRPGNVRVVSGYYPIRGELDPMPLLGALRGRGIQIALPVTKPGPTLLFRLWEPGGAVCRTKLGTQEPGEECLEVQPNLLLVPLLAFDRWGNRLGYGAGYYDSALKSLRRLGSITAIGVAFDEQELPGIPREPRDEPLDMILTPARVIVCKD